MNTLLKRSITFVALFSLLILISWPLLTAEETTLLTLDTEVDIAKIIDLKAGCDNQMLVTQKRQQSNWKMIDQTIDRITLLTNGPDYDQQMSSLNKDLDTFRSRESLLETKLLQLELLDTQLSSYLNRIELKNIDL